MDFQQCDLNKQQYHRHFGAPGHATRKYVGHGASNQAIKSLQRHVCYQRSCHQRKEVCCCGCCKLRIHHHLSYWSQSDEHSRTHMTFRHFFVQQYYKEIPSVSGLLGNVQNTYNCSCVKHRLHASSYSTSTCSACTSHRMKYTWVLVLDLSPSSEVVTLSAETTLSLIN